VIERVIEILWLVSLMILITTLWTWTTLAALWTRTTLATLWTWTTLTLNIVSRLLYEYTMRELVLTSLRVDFEELNGNLVTLLDTCLFYCLKTLPVNL
jgi:hypothetical protein